MRKNKQPLFVFEVENLGWSNCVFQESRVFGQFTLKVKNMHLQNEHYTRMGITLDYLLNL